MTRLHHPDCRWERTTPAECEYRETHHYCPHPGHACDCAEIEADRLLGEMAPEPRATDAHPPEACSPDDDGRCPECDAALTTGTRPATQEVRDGLAGLDVGCRG